MLKSFMEDAAALFDNEECHNKSDDDNHHCNYNKDWHQHCHNDGCSAARTTIPTAHSKISLVGYQCR